MKVHLRIFPGISFLIVFLWLLPIQRLHAQPYLLYQRSEALVIQNLADDSWHSLTRNAMGKLSGYKVLGDTLVAYFEIQGKMWIMRFQDTLIAKLPSYNVMFSPAYEDDHVYPKSFTYRNYSLVINSSNRICFYEDNKLKWGEYCADKSDTASNTWFTGYIRPQLSPKMECILIEAKRTHKFFGSHSDIYEIDIGTGEKKKIIKDAEYPFYDPTGNYILYRRDKSPVYFVYDRNKKEKSPNMIYDSAFWLYK